MLCQSLSSLITTPISMFVDFFCVYVFVFFFILYVCHIIVTRWDGSGGIEA